MRKVMVFGVFDGVHDGHREFLREAKLHGDYLIAVVAHDHHVRHLKNHDSYSEIGKRMSELFLEDHVDDVVLGDDELGSWNVVKRYKPDIIALGYDQDALYKELESHLDFFGWHIELIHLKAHEPHRFKSSLLNN